MAETTRRSPESPPGDGARLLRFDRVERWVHWSSAVLVVVLVASAVPLYVGSIGAMVGRRDLLRQIHVLAGLALPVPFLVAWAGRRWGARLRADVARLNRWSRDDRRWLRSWGRDPHLLSGKFNGGQKLNAAFVAGAVVVMLLTGIVMRWNQPFPVDWRTGATFVHDVVATVLVVAVIGHVLYALADREALRGMAAGTVSRRWARRRAPRWYGEVAGGDGETTGE
jgi:formate dehydrogenase subunit gamma